MSQDTTIKTEVAKTRLIAPLRWLLLTFALASLAMGFVGVVVPGIPTTPFVIMAAWAASLSSPRFHAWMVNHKILGPVLKNWEKGEIPRRAKIFASILMAFAAGLFSYIHFPLSIWTSLVLVIMASVLTWIWTRPEPKP